VEKYIFRGLKMQRTENARKCNINKMEMQRENLKKEFKEII